MAASSGTAAGEQSGRLAPDGPEARLAAAARAVGYPSAHRYRSRGEYLFRGVELRGRRLLDIGCGPGAWTLWGGLHGAAYSLGIDPEGDGATRGVMDRLRRSVTELGLDGRVEARPIGIEDLRASTPFDVIINYNVINHISEAHTQTLHEPESQAFYVEALRGIRNLLVPGGVLITADCSRHNFFGRLGLRAPLARDIDWHKHADPHQWAALMRRAGMEVMDLRWSYLYPFTGFSPPGWLAYFLHSHFVLRTRRV